jgi:CheY-like chemotaxis protein
MKKKINILYIEDNISDLYLTRDFLSELSPNIKLFSASSLEDAVTELFLKNIDGLLIDLNLPDSEGINTLKTIRKLAKNIPIIILSNVEDEKIINLTKLCGINNYFVKGKISFEKLAEVIQRCVENYVHATKVEGEPDKFSLKTEMLRKTFFNQLKFFVSRSIGFLNAMLKVVFHKPRKALKRSKETKLLFQPQWIMSKLDKYIQSRYKLGDTQSLYQVDMCQMLYGEPDKIFKILSHLVKLVTIFDKSCKFCIEGEVNVKKNDLTELKFIIQVESKSSDSDILYVPVLEVIDTHQVERKIFSPKINFLREKINTISDLIQELNGHISYSKYHDAGLNVEMSFPL